MARTLRDRIESFERIAMISDRSELPWGWQKLGYDGLLRALHERVIFIESDLPDGEIGDTIKRYVTQLNNIARLNVRQMKGRNVSPFKKCKAASVKEALELHPTVSAYLKDTYPRKEPTDGTPD